MERLPNLPIGLQYFKEIRKNDCIYVDKTEYIYEICLQVSMDTVVITKERIFLFEFKVNETAKKAIQCIKDRNYAASLRLRNLPITGVGVSFSAKTKGVADWDKEEL